MTTTQTTLTAHLRALAAEHPGPVGGALLAAAEQAERLQGERDSWRTTAAAALATVERYSTVVEAAKAYNDGIGELGEAGRLAALFDAVDALRALESQP